MAEHVDPPAGAFEIPPAELVVRASRSGGPGGQHVNTSSTRVEVRWNVADTGALSPGQRAHVTRRLGRRLDRRGWLRVVSSRSRSQHANRVDATERLTALVRSALEVPTVRKRTRVPSSERAARLEDKRRRATRKKERRPVTRRTDDE